MDKIEKLLRKLSEQERERLENVLAQLLSGDTTSLDIKKLKGVDDIYRVRIGTLRIIFKKQKSNMFILEVSRRDEGTYGKY